MCHSSCTLLCLPIRRGFYWGATGGYPFLQVANQNPGIHDNSPPGICNRIEGALIYGKFKNSKNDPDNSNTRNVHVNI